MSNCSEPYSQPMDKDLRANYRFSPHIKSTGKKKITSPLVARKVKNLPAMQVNPGWIPWSERSSGEGNGNPFWCSCLGNPMDRGASQATVHGVTKSQM